MASDSHGPAFHAEPWSLVLPLRGSILPSAALFGLGVVLAFVAFVRGRELVGLGVRSMVGFSLLAAALVTAYMAGAAVGTVTLSEALQAIVSCSPEVLFAESLILAGLGLLIGMRKPGLALTRVLGAMIVLTALGVAMVASSAGSVTQALQDIRDGMPQAGWAWGSFGLAAAGILLAYRHQGRLWPLFLAPVAVFVSVGLAYWASLGKGSPPLHEALSAPAAKSSSPSSWPSGRGPRSICIRVRPGAPGTEHKTRGSSATPGA
jgi:hypothetical protein